MFLLVHKNAQSQIIMFPPVEKKFRILYKNILTKEFYIYLPPTLIKIIFKIKLAFVLYQKAGKNVSKFFFSDLKIKLDITFSYLIFYLVQPEFGVYNKPLSCLAFTIIKIFTHLQK